MTQEGITIRKLRKVFEKDFHIPIKKERFCINDEAFYQPDIVLQDCKSREIKVIIEIESRVTRKHMVGGVISADYCMRKQQANPVYCALVLDENRLKSLKQRRKMLEDYLGHCHRKGLKQLVIGDFDEIMKQIRKLKNC